MCNSVVKSSLCHETRGAEFVIESALWQLRGKSAHSHHEVWVISGRLRTANEVNDNVFYQVKMDKRETDAFSGEKRQIAGGVVVVRSQVYTVMRDGV